MKTYLFKAPLYLQMNKIKFALERQFWVLRNFLGASFA